MKEIDFGKSDKLLIIAPHPDDETIGCGGLLIKYGSQVDVLLLTNGNYGKADNGIKSPNEVTAIRYEEIGRVCGKCKVNKLIKLDIDDGQVWRNYKKISQFSFKGYNAVFVPNISEASWDHRVVYKIINKILKRQRVVCELYEYEVWTPIIKPNYKIDISNVLADKIDLLNEYKSQNQILDYRIMTQSLAKYRACNTCFNHNLYVEVYRKKENKKGKWIYNLLPYSIKNIIRKKRNS